MREAERMGWDGMGWRIEVMDSESDMEWKNANAKRIEGKKERKK